MSKRLPWPEDRVCEDCTTRFTTNWPQRLCNPCKYNRASRSTCETCGGKTGHSSQSRCGSCRYGVPPDLRPMSRVERAWLTGVVEGEGTFGRARRPGGQVRVVMTDQDVIQRLQSVTGLGMVHERGRRAAHHKSAWEWAVTRRESVSTLVDDIAPLTEVGHIASIPRQQEHFKSSWRWSVYNQPDSRRILSAILPMLGARRSERARYVLNLIGGE